jgi:phage terminase large subunit-like protein
VRWHPFVLNPVDAYAQSVTLGAVPAGKYHRLACARHLRDRAREGTPEFPYVFDFGKAQRFYRFATKLKHYKGEWAGQFIELRPDQVFRKGVKYGWVHRASGLRRFRNSYEEIPRKNGKSLEMAVEMLYLTFFDGEGGAAGYCAATKRDQAAIVFGDCKKLVQSSGLRARLTVQAANIHSEATASKLEPLSADHNSMDGLNIHAACLDELHAMKVRGTIDVIETATGARRQPLINKITTAGDDPVSPCGDEHDYACKILDGVLEDETYFAFIAHADEDDDWTLPSTAAKANPGYGSSVNPDDLKGKVIKATNIPSAAATYKQKHLNLWLNASAPWLSLDGWRKGQTDWTLEEMHGERCWIGIDMSSKIDLTAVVLVFPPTETRKSWRIVPWCLTPADTLKERAHRDRAPYQHWVETAGLRTNPGNRIDQDVVRELVHEADSVFDVQQIAIDPWNAGNLVKDLGETDGHQVIEIPQNMQQMSAPSKDFEADVLDGLVDAGGNPLMTWCISNVVVQRDNKDNVYPVKKKSRGRIDPVIAALMARKLAAFDAPEESEDPVLVIA